MALLLIEWKAEKYHIHLLFDNLKKMNLTGITHVNVIKNGGIHYHNDIKSKSIHILKIEKSKKFYIVTEDKTKSISSQKIQYRRIGTIMLYQIWKRWLPILKTLQKAGYTNSGIKFLGTYLKLCLKI